jgi:hypothetical protein
MNIFTEGVGGAYPVEVVGNLENLAFLCKEDFYSLPVKERHCSIIIKGGDYHKRERLKNKLIPLVDVFVCTEEQFPNPVGQYEIDLDMFGRL